MVLIIILAIVVYLLFPISDKKEADMCLTLNYINNNEEVFESLNAFCFTRIFDDLMVEGDLLVCQINNLENQLNTSVTHLRAIFYDEFNDYKKEVKLRCSSGETNVEKLEPQMKYNCSFVLEVPDKRVLRMDFKVSDEENQTFLISRTPKEILIYDLSERILLQSYESSNFFSKVSLFLMISIALFTAYFQKRTSDESIKELKKLIKTKESKINK